MLKLDALRSTPLQRDPFEYLIVRDFVEREKLKQVLSDYPEVPGPGSHPPAGLKIAGHFKEMIDELLATSFRQAVEEKFDIDLTGRPTMYTVRGFCRARDGKIHTDSKTKIITVLLYMNDDSWESSTRPPAHFAQRHRPRKLRRRSRAVRRDAAGLQALRHVMARPSSRCGQASRDPAELGDRAIRRRPRTRPSWFFVNDQAPVPAGNCMTAASFTDRAFSHAGRIRLAALEERSR